MKNKKRQDIQDDSPASSGRTINDELPRQNISSRSADQTMDEKSSTMGRRNKSTGMATKDGVTGSDDDGQLTD